MSQGGEGKGEMGFLSTNYDACKTIQKKQLGLGPGSAVGEKLKREKKKNRRAKRVKQ